VRLSLDNKRLLTYLLTYLIYLYCAKVDTVKCNEFQPRYAARTYATKTSVRSIQGSGKKTDRGYILLVSACQVCFESHFLF